LKLESMAVLERVKDHEIPEEYMVQNAMMQDRLFLKYGIEQEQYNQALSHHKLNQDPNVAKIVAQVESQICDELKQKIVD
jgi:hypothetical protein